MSDWMLDMQASGVCPAGRPYMVIGNADIARDSRPQPLFFHSLIEVGDELAITVEDQRRAALAGPDQLFGRLAPARVRHGRIDVGPEAVFGGLQLLPHADWP